MDDEEDIDDDLDDLMNFDVIEESPLETSPTSSIKFDFKNDFMGSSIRKHKLFSTKLRGSIKMADRWE